LRDFYLKTLITIINIHNCHLNIRVYITYYTIVIFSLFQRIFPVEALGCVLVLIYLVVI